MKNILFILALLPTLLGFSQYQYEEVNYEKRVKKGATLFRLQTFPLAINQFDVSLERFTSDDKSLMLSSGLKLYDNIRQYVNNNGDTTYNGSSTIGCNVGLSFRKYFNNNVSKINKKSRVLYYADFSGRYFYYDRVFYEYESIIVGQDCTYNPYTGGYNCYNIYEDVYTKRNEIVNKMGIDIGFGMNIIFSETFFIDLSLGGGMRYSISNIPQQYYSSFTDNFYTGIIPRANLALGVLLN